MSTATKQQIIRQLISSRMNGPTAEAQTSWGIDYKTNLGVSIPELKDIAKQFTNDHALALALYEDDIRECKLLASMIDDPSKVTGDQIDNWAQSFTNTEIVEQVCSNLFWKSDYALSRSIEWCLTGDELLQKAGLTIAARRATDLEVKDIVFEPYIDIVENFDEDQIEYNKTTSVFALRQIALRNNAFMERVLKAATRLAESENEHRAWIGNQLLFDLKEE